MGIFTVDKKVLEQRRKEEAISRGNQQQWSKESDPSSVPNFGSQAEANAYYAGLQAGKTADKNDKMMTGGKTPNAGGIANEVKKETVKAQIKNNNKPLTSEQQDAARKKGEEQAKINYEQQKKEVEAKTKLKSTPAKPIKNEKKQESDISVELLREYGNNLFMLYTYDPSFKTDKNNGLVEMCGVLKELPPFSMSQAAWTTGPAASLTDIVKGYLCSDLMEMITTIGGNDRSFNAVDETSDRTYNGTNPVTFPLSFRIYTTQTIGSKQLTPWQTWVKLLSLFAQPSIASKVNINSIGNNVVNGVLGGLDKATSLVNSTGNILTSQKDSAKGLINAIGDTIEDVVNEAQVFVTTRDDENRVGGPANLKNYYGAKLWKLRVLPGLIQRPLIVVIEGWGVTFSKERNLDNSQPIYLDFTINCKLDQIPNAGNWMYYLDRRANKAGYFYDRSNLTEQQKKARKALGGTAKPDTDYTWEQVEILDIPEPQTVTKDGESYILYYEWVKSGEFNSNVYRLNEIRI